VSVARRYDCTFANEDGEQHIIAVTLTSSEMETARRQKDPDLVARCYALRHAYKTSPVGFYHVAYGQMPIFEC
jgi:hypothetical protein